MPASESAPLRLDPALELIPTGHVEPIEEGSAVDSDGGGLIPPGQSRLELPQVNLDASGIQPNRATHAAILDSRSVRVGTAERQCSLVNTVQTPGSIQLDIATCIDWSGLNRHRAEGRRLRRAARARPDHPRAGIRVPALHLRSRPARSRDSVGWIA
jgi:hypothetical protein